MIKSVNVNAITIDGGTQSREKLDEMTVAEYTELIKEGTEFPPISVVSDGNEYYLADGFHRLMAAKKAGKASINCDVITGTLRDAILYSLSANHMHGLRRSIDDKRKAVLTMLADVEWSDWSDREIARQCHVSHTFVQRLRSNKKEEKSGNVATSQKGIGVHKITIAEPEPVEQDVKDAVIEELKQQNDDLRQRMAIKVMDATPEEKKSAEALIQELRDEIKQLEIENKALTVSRDTFQAENAQLKKQVKMLQKKLKANGAE